ncbi:MAG: glycosyltransferase family 4 protein [Anaerolineales bacterium]|nr:glycosyltransferase family 4 protein [Anaerolineales bacterium]
MRILFIADGRSPIALNWIRYWVERGDEVHLVSTFACETDLKAASFHLVPVAFSGSKQAAATRKNKSKGILWGAAALQLRLMIRHWAGPFTIRTSANRLREIIKDISPDLVHALRIPYEGMLAVEAGPEAPLIVSVWGNDFTLHAASTPLMSHYTERTMKAVDALHADCRRDIRLAKLWGLPETRPAIVLPGNGGIDTNLFHPPANDRSESVIINPRGFRNYVRNDTFFKAIPKVLERYPQARFVCPDMAGEKKAVNWIKKYGIEHAVELLPLQSRQQLAELYRRSKILVSPSTHDGTPNTLLEGMACGCYPVVGDIESLREWIIPGENGALIDPGDVSSLANAVIAAITNNNLCKQAAVYNAGLIAERAEYQHCMTQAEKFYEGLLS